MTLLSPRTYTVRGEKAATRELVVLAACLAALLSYLALERVLLARALRRVPRRIAVAGTRGKSGVTRLIAAGLRESGARVMAKTTGSKPMLILPDGGEREIARPGGPSVREQVRLVRAAAKAGAATLVSEMMSIGAECLAAESRSILRPGTLVLTNVRLDHLNDMGRRKEDIARTLTSAFPGDADIFLPAEESYAVFEEAAAASGSRLHPVAAPSNAGASLPFGEFEPNVRLALAVLDLLGVEKETALQGVARARPDFGGLRIWTVRSGDPPRRADCVSAFAANEPESTAAALARVRERISLAGRPLVGVLSLREDRGDRTLQWIRAAGEGFFRDFARIVLVGPTAAAAVRRMRASPCPGGTAFSRFDAASPGALMEHILSAVPGEPVIVGLGNIAGPGERIVGHWNREGVPHDR